MYYPLRKISFQGCHLPVWNSLRFPAVVLSTGLSVPCIILIYLSVIYLLCVYLQKQLSYYAISIHVQGVLWSYSFSSSVIVCLLISSPFSNIISEPLSISSLNYSSQKKNQYIYYAYLRIFRLLSSTFYTITLHIICKITIFNIQCLQLHHCPGD